MSLPGSIAMDGTSIYPSSNSKEVFLDGKPQGSWKSSSSNPLLLMMYTLRKQKTSIIGLLRPPVCWQLCTSYYQLNEVNWNFAKVCGCYLVCFSCPTSTN